MKFSSIIDISWPISQAMTAYKDKKTVSIMPTKEFDRDGARESVLTLGSHSGTHVDAPSHFLQAGKTIDAIDLNTLVGPCRVLDLTECSDRISASDLEMHAIEENSIILCKTKNSMLAPDALFEKEFVYLDASAAHYLAQKRIKSVGIDYLGIERMQPDHQTHTILFNAGTTIIEGLRLRDVHAGFYFLCCLPLAVQGAEAAPARAILFK